MKAGFSHRCFASLALGAALLAAVPTFAEVIPVTNAFPTEPLSLADAVNIALRLNPDVLKGQKDLEASQGVVIQTRAVALPKVRVTGNYSAYEPSAVDKLSVTFGSSGFNFGTDQSWSSQIRLTQSLFEGGKVVSALRAAKLTGQLAVLNYHTAVADAVLQVQIAYYGVLLAAQQIAVQEASVALLTDELADNTRRFDAGTVPRFNVLRADVELASARPKLIHAKNNLRIARNILANALGLNVPKDTLQDIPLQLSGKLEKVPLEITLTDAIAQALERRTELGALRKTQALRKEDIANAKSGYLPSVQAFAGYEAGSSVFDPDLTHELHGWLAGVQLSWDVFDGRRTKGKVMETTALFEKTGVELDETSRRIELEVRTAHSIFVEADEILESQTKVVEQAEEALRLAQSRTDAGAGTQLDVLAAQRSLTDARTTQIEALHDFVAARARLVHAIGHDWNDK
jgi:outer membrane protein TolC